jgi:hypothetical protein
VVITLPSDSLLVAHTAPNQCWILSVIDWKVQLPKAARTTATDWVVIDTKSKE